MLRFLIPVFIGFIFMALNKTSQAGINNIKKYEALALTPYRDAAGFWTIGYGHKIILPSEQWILDKGIITKEQAEDFLKRDLKIAENAVSNLVKVNITSNMHDALVSLIYNIGAGAFEKSTLLKKLNNGDYNGAANEFDKWKYSGGEILPGLVVRRSKEKQTFIT